MKTRINRLLRRERGQSMIEFAVVLPLLLVVVLGVVEVSYALYDQHVVTRMTREGANLISRDTTLGDAINVLRNMSSPPVSINSNAKVIFSVLMNVPTTGTTNYNRVILYARATYGSTSGNSVLQTAGGSYGPAPEYTANNPNGDSGLRVTNLPANVVVPLGGMVYVCEIYSNHTLITPFNRFGITVPNRLYSIAYF
jgi:Flp pilus assembly protein TadG